MSAKLYLNFVLILLLGVVAALPVVAQTEDGDKDKPEIVSTDTENGDAENNDPEKEKVEEVKSFYTNYLTEYTLGPQDIISVDVFGQPDYSRRDISVPPTARISYPLIREGVFVGGKTVEQVAEEITEQLSEYIIDPKVTVTLNRPGSARYAVMGRVNAPGVRIMDRRVSINEAIIEAGGLAKGASKNKIVISRFNKDGVLETEKVDLKAIERGKVPTIFLKPGDQVFIGDKGFTWGKALNVLGQLSAARILFGSPF